METERTETGLRGGLAAAWLSFPAAYFYVEQVLCKSHAPGGARGRWEHLAFTLLFAAAVEAWSAVQKRARRRPEEAGLWCVCLLLEGLGMGMHGIWNGSIGFWQLLLWHVTAVLFVLARTGQLTEGRSGIFLGRDLLRGSCVLPWRNYLLRIRTLLRGHRTERIDTAPGETETTRGHAHRFILLAGSAAAALLISAFAWGQLAAASSSFARLGAWLTDPVGGLLAALDRALGNFLDTFEDRIAFLLLSLPVGAWLFGLVGGALQADEEEDRADRIRAAMERRRKLPGLPLYLTAGALTLVYLAFFAVQISEVAARMDPSFGGHVVTPFSAMSFAVNGFWELCRILLLNLAVFGTAVFFCREDPLKRGPARAAGGALIVCSMALSLLNMAKLSLYIRLCGFTPRRITAGWILLVLAVCVGIAGCRLCRTFRAAELAIRVTALSFAVLCCFGVEAYSIRDDLQRYEAGIDAAPDVTLLAECGFCAQGEVIGYTERLLEDGWFEGRDRSEIYTLYAEILDSETGWGNWPDGGEKETWEIPLRGAGGAVRKLAVTLEGGRCTGAILE